jgi:hypothetical protein
MYYRVFLFVFSEKRMDTLFCGAKAEIKINTTTLISFTPVKLRKPRVCIEQSN